MASSTGTTKFELFFLILWLLLSITLIALLVLRKLTVPALIKNDRNMSIAFAVCQLLIFVLALAALGENTWSRYTVSSGFGFGSYTVHFGLVDARTDGIHWSYDCGDNFGTSSKTACRTVKAAGIFTLLFGILAMFASAALCVVVALALLGKDLLARFHPFVSIVSLIQLVAVQAMMFIWGVSGQGPLHSELSHDVKVGASWALIFVVTVLAIPTAIFHQNGPGIPVVGEPATTVTVPPMDAKQQQNMQVV